MKDAMEWLMANKENLALSVLALLSFLEIIVRFTPTKKDDSALERIGSVIRKVLDFLKVPNVRK